MAQQTHGTRMGGRGAAGMMPGEKAKNFKGTMAKLLRYLSRFLPAIITVLVCAAASTVFSIFGPKVLGQATTKLFEGVMAMLTGTGGIDFSAIGQILLFLLAIYLVSALLSYVQGWVMAGVATKVSYSMRRDISEKIDRMPLSYFDRVPNGEVLSRITNDVDTVTQTLNQSLSQIVTNVTMMVGVLCMMLSISPLMTLVALCILPVERADCDECSKAQPALLPPAAGLSGPCERPCGGDVRRARGGDGLRARGREPRRIR